MPLRLAAFALVLGLSFAARGGEVIGVVKRFTQHAAPLERRLVNGAEVRFGEFTSEGAARVRLHFTSFALPEGASLRVCSRSNDCHGPYTDAGPLENGDFWAPPVKGDTAVIEYRGPGQPFEVVAMTHTFPTEDTFACQPPVAPEWESTARSVAAIDIVDNAYDLEVSCSGVLLRTDANDFTPYVLTANHCVPDQKAADTAVFRWRFDSASEPGYLSTYADFIAGSDTLTESDYSLLMVRGAIPRNLVSWADWTRTMPAFGTSVVGLHHPNSDDRHTDAWMRMATGRTSSNCACGGGCNCDYMLHVEWNAGSGFGEDGSSGSGLWTLVGGVPKLIGQLRGTHPDDVESCSNFAARSHYGRFDRAYDDLTSLRTPHYLAVGADDDMEDNDTMATATVIGHGLYATRFVKANDEDWYRITVPAGQQLVIDARFQAWRGDVDLEVRVNGAVTHLNTRENYEHFEVVAGGSAKDVYIRAYLYDGVRNQYNLTTSLSPAGTATVSLSPTDVNASESGDTATLTVTRTGSTAAAMTVYYALSGGPAANGIDFETLDGMVTIAAGSSSGTIVIRPIDDDVHEGPETLKPRISSGPGYSAVGTTEAVVTIADNDAPLAVVTATASDATATEVGATTGTFVIRRSGTTNTALTVGYQLDGTATAADYQPLSGSVTIPANTFSANVVLTPINDALAEEEETVRLTIKPGQGYMTDVPYRATVAISDDDNPKSTVTVFATDNRAIESGGGDTTARIRFVRTNGNQSAPLTINYTLGGTAANGADYFSLPGSITIPANASEATLIITPLADNVPEPDETVTLTVNYAQAYLVGNPSYAAVTIVNTDQALGTRFDLNADRRADIVWRDDSSGQNAVWLMNGGTVAGSTYIDPLSNGMQLVAQGDFDGDLKTDLLWRNASAAQTAIWFMNGTVVWRGAYLPAADASWRVVGTGDFNKDGRSDIFWNRTNGENAIWFMNAENVTGTPVTAAASPWQPGVIGDFDGNGTADITWREGNTGQIVVWLMNGATIASSGYLPTASSDWLLLHAGDLNADGMDDLIWRNPTAGGNAVWFLSGLNLTSSAYLPGLDGGWTNEGVGDFDGDGDADLLWRSASTSQTAMWLMNGVEATGVYLPPVASSWTIAPRR